MRAAVFLKGNWRDRGSAFRELEALAGTRLAGLLAFLHAGIAGEKSERFHNFAIFWIHLGERARNGVTNGNGLRVRAATLDDHHDIKLVHQCSRLKRRKDGILKFNGRQIFFERTFVDRDLAGAFGHPDAGYSGFAASSGAMSGGGGHVKNRTVGG